MSPQQDFPRICVQLQSEEKERRKNALNEVLKILQTQTEREKVELWHNINKLLAKLLSDPSEKCRDLTLEILSNFLQILKPEDRNIVYILPILSRRLGSSERLENSEEIRLKCVILVRIVMKNYKDYIPVYTDDVTNILIKCLSDNYHLVKHESLVLLQEFAKNFSKHFYPNTEQFVKPVIRNLNHQHHKIRNASIRTIGDLILYGNSNCLEEVATPLAERLFDSIDLVRLAVVEVAADWLQNLSTRYSWFHRLIPLILTGLHDNNQTIRNKSNQLWNVVGEKYLKENDNNEKLKDRMDFPNNNMTCPIGQRPNLGCRTIVQQSFSKLVNGIISELTDWKQDIRVRTAQLLCVMILHVEEGVTQHLGKILPTMYRACNDEDKRVVENIEQAAEYIGCFVDPEICYSLILPTLEDSVTAGHLKVLSAVIRGGNAVGLSTVLEKIVKLLREICQGKKKAYREQILNCCSSILIVCGKSCQKFSEDLYITLFTILSISTESHLKFNIEKELTVLAEINNITTTKLHKNYMSILMKILCESNSKSWTAYSVEFQIFCTIFQDNCARKSLGERSEILDILLEIMAEDGDVEIKLKIFVLMAMYFDFESWKVTDRNDIKFFTDPNPSQFIEKIILPGLIWSAGRSAEAIRTAAISCLNSLLENYLELNNLQAESFLDPKFVFEKITPALISLSDDNSKKARLYALKALYCIMLLFKRTANCVKEEYIHRIYPVVLKRLDDACDDIRLSAIESLSVIWKCVEKEYNLDFNAGHIDCVYTSCIIHLDDPENVFQDAMLETLKELARIHPELLYKKVQNSKFNFRNQKGMMELLKHCQTLLQNEVQ